jgi:hypothetical protein
MVYPPAPIQQKFRFAAVALTGAKAAIRTAKSGVVQAALRGISGSDEVMRRSSKIRGACES